MTTSRLHEIPFPFVFNTLEIIYKWNENENEIGNGNWTAKMTDYWAELSWAVSVSLEAIFQGAKSVMKTTIYL